MKKFIVKETRPAMAIWTYEVEAKSESEAMAKVFDEMDIKKADLAYDVDFEADMGVEIDEEPSTSNKEIPGSPEAFAFTKQELIEFTRTIQDRCRVAAFEAINNAGIDYEDMVELELGYDNQILISIDKDELHNEIEIAIDSVFKIDDNDAVYEEITDVIKYIVEYRKV
jgi:hypothetical protein